MGKDLFELYTPRAKKEREWVDLHKVEKDGDVEKNGDDFYADGGVKKPSPRKKTKSAEVNKDTAGEVCEDWAVLDHETNKIISRHGSQQKSAHSAARTMDYAHWHKTGQRGRYSAVANHGAGGQKADAVLKKDEPEAPMLDKSTKAGKPEKTTSEVLMGALKKHVMKSLFGVSPRGGAVRKSGYGARR